MNRDQIVQIYNNIPFPVPTVERDEWEQVGSMWFAPKYRVRVYTKYTDTVKVRDGDTVVVISAGDVRILGEGMLVVAEGIVNRVTAAQMQVNICVCAGAYVDRIELTECDANIVASRGIIESIWLFRPHVMDFSVRDNGRINEIVFPEMTVSGKDGHRMLYIGDIE